MTDSAVDQADRVVEPLALSTGLRVAAPQLLFCQPTGASPVIVQMET